MKMSIELLAEYKERLKIASENHDSEGVRKYYKLFTDGYKELTGENFENVLNEYRQEKARLETSENSTSNEITTSIDGYSGVEEKEEGTEIEF